MKRPPLRDLAAANARIVELEAQLPDVLRVANLAERRAERAEDMAATAERYVAACRAIREAPYPSAAFTEAVAHASACYHALLVAFP